MSEGKDTLWMSPPSSMPGEGATSRSPIAVCKENDGSPSHGNANHGLEPKSVRQRGEEEEIVLLREIFPEMSTRELEDLHFNRISDKTKKKKKRQQHSTKHQQETADGCADGASEMSQFDVYDELGDETEAFPHQPASGLTSKLGKRIWLQYLTQKKYVSAGRAEPEIGSKDHHDSPGRLPQHMLQVQLPDDFLRIPKDVAVRLRNEETGTFEWMSVEELERLVLEEHFLYDAHNNPAENVFSPVFSTRSAAPNSLADSPEANKLYGEQVWHQSEDGANDHFEFTKVLNRGGMSVGLGMTIRELDGCIFVHALVCSDGTRIFTHGEFSAISPVGRSMGPAFVEGILPGDRILGLNGRPFLQWRVVSEHDYSERQSVFSSIEILRSAVEAITNAPDPVVVHLRRTRQPFDSSARQKSLCSDPRTRNLSGSAIPRSFSAASISVPSLEGEKQRNSSPPKDITQTLDSTPVHAEDGGVSKLRDEIPPEIESTNQHSKVKESAKEVDVNGVHPFAGVLASRGLIQVSDGPVLTKHLIQYTERTRQWESTSSFRIDSSNFVLRPHFDPRDLPPSEISSALPFEYENAKSLRPYAPSTPTVKPTAQPMLNGGSGSFQEDEQESHRLLRGRQHESDHDHRKNVSSKRALRGYPASHLHRSPSLPPMDRSDIFIPLIGVRKALSVRVVNTFLDHDRTAYTIWVYDNESGREWYAPIRYYSDFKDLRTATATLVPMIGQIPFPPAKGFRVFRGHVGSELETAKLERFLRGLCGLLYKQQLSPNAAEVAVHLQSFLGCDTGLGLAENEDPDLQLHRQVAVNETTHSRKANCWVDDIESNARLLLKRSIQRYTYRIFLLPTMELIVDQFVASAKETAPTTDQMNALDRKSRTALKENALEELEKVQSFLDQVQELVLEGCCDDLEFIAHRRDFLALRKVFDSKNGNTYRDKLFREAVREQIEIEVYVSLRSTISRLLVNGWRHDDMEMQFKMKELRKRPQSFFKIHPDNQSPSNWMSASRILNEGVGRSTLPCAKLRAIVDAAEEITRLHGEEHSDTSDVLLDFTRVSLDGKPQQGLAAGVDGPKSELGADDFLPIFIHCVVHAEIERPCALCVLLRTLCEPAKRIGETGYYLATFEAAIAHIRDLDLADEILKAF